MRHLRALLYFIVGVLLAAHVVIASAETVPPALYVKYRANSVWYGPEFLNNNPTQAACAAAVSERFPTGAYRGTLNASGTCEMKTASGSFGGTLGYENFRVGCPDSTWTYEGGQCTRPDCPSGQPRQPDGTCADKCSATKDKYTSGWVSYTGSKVPTGNVCIDGCNYQQNAMIDQDDRIGTDGRIWAQVGQTGLGTSCTDGQTGQTPDQKNKDSKPTPCGATDGVMTTSSGKVLCVPEGTPDARKPDVKVQKKEETYPDNSKKQTTETTTRDPQTGATSTNTTTTTTPKPDGTEGQAGPVGTTTGVATSGSGNGNGDGEGCDPTKQACGKKPGTFGENGDLYEAKYPDGLSGLLDEKYSAMKATPIFGLVNQLAPTGLSNSGTCPTWSFSGFSNSRISIGQMDFNMPCWVWDAVRAIMLVTTLLLARRLVFGG